MCWEFLTGTGNSDLCACLLCYPRPLITLHFERLPSWPQACRLISASLRALVTGVHCHASLAQVIGGLPSVLLVLRTCAVANKVLLLGGLLGAGAGAVSSAPRGSIASSKSEPPNLCLAGALQGNGREDTYLCERRFHARSWIRDYED